MIVVTYVCLFLVWFGEFVWVGWFDVGLVLLLLFA